MPLSCHYRSDQMYNIKRIQGSFETKTLFADMKSLYANTCCQVYSHKAVFPAWYTKLNVKGYSLGEALDDYVHEFGSLEHLTFDGFQYQVSKNTKFFKNLHKYNIDHHVYVPRSPNQNPAEGTIREIKRCFYQVMQQMKLPKNVWDYQSVWICDTRNLSLTISRYAKGQTTLGITTGEIPDISEYLDFGFYDWVTYLTNSGLGELSIGKWMGVLHKVGKLMSYLILTVYGRPISYVNFQRLTEEEQ